jgi:hypothetical protein
MLLLVPLQPLLLREWQAPTSGLRRHRLDVLRCLQPSDDFLDQELGDVKERLNGNDELLVPRSNDAHILGHDLVI